MGRNEVTYGQLLHGYSMIPCPKENCCFVCCLFHRDSSLCGNSDFSGLVFVCLTYALLSQRFSWFPFTYPEPDLNLM